MQFYHPGKKCGNFCLVCKNKIFRGGIISGQVSGIAGGSEKSSAGVGGLVKIPLDCTVERVNESLYKWPRSHAYDQDGHHGYK